MSGSTPPIRVLGAPRGVPRRRACALVWGLAVLTVPGGCGRPEALRIGFLGGLSGRVSDLGVDGRNGAQLAVDDLNDAGGIEGRPVELVARDDEQNVERAMLRLQELIDAGVAAIVGPMTSSIAAAVAPAAAAKGMVLISPTATTHELSGKADHFFRVIPDARRGAAQQAAVLFASGHRRIVVATDAQNKAFADSWADAALARFTELGGRVAGRVAFDSSPGLNVGEVAGRLAAAIDASSPTCWGSTSRRSRTTAMLSATGSRCGRRPTCRR